MPQSGRYWYKEAQGSLFDPSTIWGFGKKALPVRQSTSPHPTSVKTLVINFQPPPVRWFYCFKSPDLWYFCLISTTRRMHYVGEEVWDRCHRNNHSIGQPLLNSCCGCLLWMSANFFFKKIENSILRTVFLITGSRKSLWLAARGSAFYALWFLPLALCASLECSLCPRVFNPLLLLLASRRCFKIK